MIMIHDDDHVIGQATRIAAHIMASQLAQLNLASNAECTDRFSKKRACSSGKLPWKLWPVLEGEDAKY